MNCRSIVETAQTTSKPGVDVNPGPAWREPADWPCDVRHRGSASLVRAPMLNCGNLRPRCKGKGTSATRKADSTEARSRGGAARSSDEVAVMAMERRGRVIGSGVQANCASRRSVSDMTKPFAIPKALVWEAFQRVKANGGSAGVDDESIEAFERTSRRQSVQALESDGVRQLFSAAGQSRADSEEERGHADVGRANGRRSSRTNGGQDGPRAGARASLRPRLIWLSAGALGSGRGGAGEAAKLGVRLGRRVRHQRPVRQH